MKVLWHNEEGVAGTRVRAQSKYSETMLCLGQGRVSILGLCLFQAKVHVSQRKFSSLWPSRDTASLVVEGDPGPEDSGLIALVRTRNQNVISWPQETCVVVGSLCGARWRRKWSLPCWLGGEGQKFFSILCSNLTQASVIFPTTCQVFTKGLIFLLVTQETTFHASSFSTG